MAYSFFKKGLAFSTLYFILLASFSLSAYSRGNGIGILPPSRTLNPDDARTNEILAAEDGTQIKEASNRNYWRYIILPDGLAYDFEKTPLFEETYYFELKLIASTHLYIPTTKDRKRDIGKTNVAGQSNCSLIPKDLNQSNAIYIQKGEVYTIEGAFIAHDSWTEWVVFDLFNARELLPFELICRKSTVLTLNDFISNLVDVFEVTF